MKALGPALGWGLMGAQTGDHQVLPWELSRKGIQCGGTPGPEAGLPGSPPPPPHAFRAAGASPLQHTDLLRSQSPFCRVISPKPAPLTHGNTPPLGSPPQTRLSRPYLDPSSPSCSRVPTMAKVRKDWSPLLTDYLLPA